MSDTEHDLAQAAQLLAMAIKGEYPGRPSGVPKGASYHIHSMRTATGRRIALLIEKLAVKERKKKMNEYEWKSIELPRSMGYMGPGVDVGVMHYLEIEGKWKIFICEPPSYEDDGYQENDGLGECIVHHHHGPPIRWAIAFEGVEIVCGSLKTVETSKRTALLILEALIQGPPPELPEKGGYSMIVPRGGSGMGH